MKYTGERLKRIKVVGSACWIASLDYACPDIDYRFTTDRQNSALFFGGDASAIYKMLRERDPSRRVLVTVEDA